MKLSTKIISLGLLVVIGFYTARIFTLRDFAEQSKSQIFSQLEEAKGALASLSPNDARAPLQGINSEINNLQLELEKFGVLEVASLWDKLTNGLKGLPGIVTDVAGISGTAIHINEDLESLRREGPSLLLSGPGEDLLLKLDNLQSKLSTLYSYVKSLNVNQDAVDAQTKKSLSDFADELNETKQSVDALRRFLDPTSPAHVLVLFQNESELRPAGGFIGSYADLTVQGGSIRNIEVRDIYDPDGQLDIKMIPPEPLQRLTRDWEARDANWFFDYPTSAKQVISFLNQSKIYSEQGITFSGAIAVNTKVLGDLISLVGPIHLPEYKATLTPETFLRELQREVESGEDKKKNQPKKILQSLLPIILNELKNQSEDGHKQLMEKVRYHLASKNIMLYLDSPSLQRKLESLGVSGNVTPTTYTTSTVGDYLAVVSANMAGGKSDYVTRQKITLESSFDASGTLSHLLQIEREHSGANETDWWYRSPNKTYTQVYMPLGTRLDDASGALPLPKSAGWDYRGYAPDPKITAIELTKRIFPDQSLERFVAFGKTVFAGWITTPTGGSSDFLLQYKNPKRFDPTMKTYELIFDKQSGANTSLDVTIKSPPGYIWQETGTDTLNYSSDDPVGQVRIVGTFVKHN